MSTQAKTPETPASNTKPETSKPEAKSPPMPPPPPKPSLEQTFTTRLDAIFAGQRTPEAELFEPLERLDPRKHEIIGVVNDPKSRELFSLARRLEEEQKCVPLARKPGQIPQHETDVATINNQRKTVLSLFWHHAKATGIKAGTPTDVSIGIVQGWKLVVTPSEGEGLSHLIEVMGMGLPPGLLDRLRRSQDGDDDDGDRRPGFGGAPEGD